MLDALIPGLAGLLLVIAPGALVKDEGEEGEKKKVKFGNRGGSHLQSLVSTCSWIFCRYRDGTTAIS